MKKQNNEDAVYFGGSSFPSTTWTQNEIDEINEIKNKFKFKIDYDLPLELSKVIDFCIGTSHIIECNPSKKQQIEYINEVYETADKLLHLLSITKMGDKIRKLLQKYHGPTFDMDISAINAIISSSFSAFVTLKHNNEDEENATSDEENMASLPTNDAPANTKKLKKNCLTFLHEIFTEGSLLKP